MSLYDTPKSGDGRKRLGYMPGLGEDECWNWEGIKDPEGYGIRRIGDKGVRAHRWSYEHHVGPIPEGKVIDHLCSNPSCVNPSHLEPVDQKVNRQRGKGTKMNPDIRETIIALSEKGLTHRAIAAQVPVSQATVTRLINGTISYIF